jgi:hypothetical protein
MAGSSSSQQQAVSHMLPASQGSCSQRDLRNKTFRTLPKQQPTRTVKSKA